MDKTFGLNMQKSGLMDTMSDLIIDSIGAGIAALAGYLYLTKSKYSFFKDLLEQNYVANKSIMKHNQKLKQEQEDEK